MTVSEAAAELGLTVQAVAKRLRSGAMRGEQVHPRLWLIPREEVERAKAAGRIKPGPKRRDPIVEHRQDETEHDEALEEGRRRILGEPD